MSNYELVDTYYTARSALFNDIMMYMTVLFAFLSVSYLVAEKLSNFQSVALTGLYTVFISYVAFGVIDSQTGVATVVWVLTGDDIFFSLYITGGILVSAWILSVVLFIQARKGGDT